MRLALKLSCLFRLDASAAGGVGVYKLREVDSSASFLAT